MLNAGNVTEPAESTSAGTVPPWIQLVAVAVLALVALILLGVLAIMGRSIPDAILSPASGIVGALLALVRPRPS